MADKTISSRGATQTRLMLARDGSQFHCDVDLGPELASLSRTEILTALAADGDVANLVRIVSKLYAAAETKAGYA